LVQVRYLEERQTFAPEQVTAMMLTKLKEIAEAYLKTKVVDCVISVCLLSLMLFSAAFYSCIFCVSVVLASVRLSSEYIIFNRYWYTNFYCNVCCESHWTLSGFVHHPLLLLCPAWVAKYCNEWVCLSPHITRKPCGWISPNFLFKLPVAVALFSSDGVAMCYVLTVLWMTSSFHIPRDQWTEIQYFGTSSLVCTNVITSL